MHLIVTPSPAPGARADVVDPDVRPSVLDAVRGVAVTFAPSLALNAAWVGATCACLRALRRRRRPGLLPLALVASAVAYHGTMRPRLRGWGATGVECMERRRLLGIKQRAERVQGWGSSA